MMLRHTNYSPMPPNSTRTAISYMATRPEGGATRLPMEGGGDNADA